MVDLDKNYLQSLFPNISNIIEIQKYINQYWKKNHILSNNKKLLCWQHSFKKKKIDFLISKKQKKIISILGVINQSRDKSYSEVSLAIWHSKNKLFGLNLILKLFKVKSIKIIKATTMSPGVVDLYKLLGFTVQNFNQYYLTNIPKKKQIISKNLIETKINNKITTKNFFFKKINHIFKYKKNLSNKNYIKWRFCNHPIHEYYFISDNIFNLILICRISTIKKIKFLSVVDFYGSFKKKIFFIKKINLFLKEHNFHHIEFLHYGSEDKNIIDAGFKKANKEAILPLYTQPYIGVKKRNMICAYKITPSIKKIKIVRADGDSDRP